MVLSHQVPVWLIGTASCLLCWNCGMGAHAWYGKTHSALKRADMLSMVVRLFWLAAAHDRLPWLPYQARVTHCG